MSRIGGQIIEVPQGTEVSVSDDAIEVKGKGGVLKRPLHKHVLVSVSDGSVTVEPQGNSRLARALWGTFASHIKNMIAGVNEPFVKKLIIEGVGFRADSSGDTLTLNVGYSHPVTLQIPEGISASVEKNEITVSGIDKELVGQFSADIRAAKKPEPYKGKGIRYENEVVRRKQGKRAVA